MKRAIVLIVLGKNAFLRVERMGFVMPNRMYVFVDYNTNFFI